MMLSRVLFLFIFSSLKANDTAATIAAGGITYDKSSEISMDSEVLKISLENIHIDYHFTNHASKDITSTVTFPLPPSPVMLGDTASVLPDWDDLFLAHSLVFEMTPAVRRLQPRIRSLSERRRHAAFSNFNITVDGINCPFNLLPRAIHKDGQDITSLLIENNIPLSATFVRGFMGEEHFIEANLDLRQKLQKLRLITDDNIVLWQLYIDYVWSQTFPAGKTIHVTHSYRPHAGYFWLYGKPSETLKDLKFHHRDEIKPDQLEIKNIQHYCPTKADIAVIEDMFGSKDAPLEGANGDLKVNYPVREIKYVLSTGANWRGPIKKFRLEITPPSSSTRIMACFPVPLQRNEQGIYVAEVENFTPKTDLKILFIDCPKADVVSR